MVSGQRELNNKKMDNVQTEYANMILNIFNRAVEEAVREATANQKRTETGYMTVKKVSEYIGLSTSTINNLTREGKLKFFQPSGKHGRKLFTKEMVEDYLNG